LIFTSCSGLADEVCFTQKTGKIKFVHHKKNQEQKTAYCFDKSKEMFYSLHCFKRNDCQAKNFKKNTYTFDAKSGSPGFKLCQWFYHGIPQILDYWDGQRWITSSRCIFADNSFIDIATLEMFSK